MVDDNKLMGFSYDTPKNSSIFMPPFSNLEEKQSLKLYKDAKKLLNIEERLKDYVPEFSLESEITLYNVLDLDERGLEGLEEMAS